MIPGTTWAGTRIHRSGLVKETLMPHLLRRAFTLTELLVVVVVPRIGSREASSLVADARTGQVWLWTYTLNIADTCGYAHPRDAAQVDRCEHCGTRLDAANSEFGHQIEGTPAIEESLLAVPLRYGSQVVGVIVVLGKNQCLRDVGTARKDFSKKVFLEGADHRPNLVR